mmetsp:Transcript_98852/g.180841  ORF Transcript_98852/g.180841 Transcript_98852/m.180841 type:complete len:140 (-) Transcript_98852:2-421(-)
MLSQKLRHGTLIFAKVMMIFSTRSGWQGVHHAELGDMHASNRALMKKQTDRVLRNPIIRWRAREGFNAFKLQVTGLAMVDVRLSVQPTQHIQGLSLCTVDHPAEQSRSLFCQGATFALNSMGSVCCIQILTPCSAFYQL